MKFTYECDGMDGLILVDKKYLDEINETILYELDIFLDRYGKSELVYDFPDEKWEDVRKRETKDLIEFCNSGKMVIFLHYSDEENCEIKFSELKSNSRTAIDLKSGKLLLVNASELIQCLTYPDLEMETILEIDNIDSGFYYLNFEGIKDIILQRKTGVCSDYNNVIEFYTY